MAAKSLAEELLSCVLPYSYTSKLSCLTTDDFVSLRTFPKTELGKMFTSDRQGCRKDGEINNNHLFDLFGRYSEEDAESVCTDAMERIECGSLVYESEGAEFFMMRGLTYKEWALTACNHYYYGDELLIYALCRIFHRHGLVVCFDCIWSTIKSDISLMTSELLDICDLHWFS